jgi:V8-like Glu-specific endopeptidase
MSKVRISAAIAFVTLLVMMIPAPAGAIINGIPDGKRHPNAGALIWKPENLVYCSAFLIAPQYVATAAHCLHDLQASDIAVTFDEVPGPRSKLYQARIITPHPEFDINERGGIPQFGMHDYGLIELTAPVTGVPEADLPPIGAADQLPRGTPILEVAGYGATDTKGMSQTYPDTRHYAVLSLRTGESAGSATHLAVSGKQTAACFGDSGGPTYLGRDVSVVYGITSFVTDLQCAGWNFQIRLDTADAHGFFGPVD